MCGTYTYLYAGLRKYFQMDNSSSGAELAQKYQKLATEYSKLRTHTSVLKKAISDEQARNSDMKELLNEKDQLTRKLEQEIECLNFRNMQLMKRVGILQEDLSAIDEKTKKNKTKSQSSPIPNETKSILDAELQSRIHENEKLHQQVYMNEMEQKKIVEDLSLKLAKIQAELSHQEVLFNERLNTKESTLQKLTDERAKIEIRLKNLEKELLDCQLKESACKEDLEKVQVELGGRLENTLQTLEQNVPFVSKFTSNTPQLDTPVFVHQYWKDITGYLSTLGGQITDLLRKLSDLHMYMEQSVQLFMLESSLSQGESDILRKLIVILHEHTIYLKPIESSYSCFYSNLENDSTLLWSEGFSSSTFVSDISKYVAYIQKLLPYIQLSLQMKIHLSTNIPRLPDALRALQDLSVQIVQGFSKLERWLTLLSSLNELHKSHNVKTNPNFIIQKITESILYIINILEEMRRQYSCRIAVEHQMPTVSDDVKSTDQCVLSCLVSLTKIFQKMLSVTNGSQGVFDKMKLFGPLRHNPSVHGAVVLFRKRATKYIKDLDEDPPAEIPYCIAVKNQASVQGYTENQEVLKQQFSALDKKVTKLEQEKEHWKLECQLLKAKQKKENKAGSPESTDSTEQVDSCVTEHIHALVCKLQLADSKAVAFHTECNVLYQRLQISEEQCQKFKVELQDTKANFEILKEELQATIKNYEVQLGTMTEHLANMNEKLTSQKEEIDALKHANVKKSKSK